MSSIKDWLVPADRSISRAGTARSLRLRRSYSSDVEAVWSACTDPERLARWLGPVSGSLAEGGEIVVDLGGPDRSASCTVVRCAPPNRLVVTWQWPGEVESAIDLRLRASPDGGTELTLEHVALDSARLAAGYGEGWESGLWKLDQLLQGVAPVEPEWAEVEAALDPYWTRLPETDSGDWPTVERTGDTAALTAERRLPAPPEAVWSAITRPERLRRWFAELELRDEGAWTATFTQGKAYGVVRTCEPGRLLVTSWRWDHEETESELTIRLDPAEPGGTLLRLSQTGVEARPAAGYGAGWHAHLAGLATHLGGTDPAEEDWTAEFSLARLVLRRTQSPGAE